MQSLGTGQTTTISVTVLTMFYLIIFQNGGLNLVALMSTRETAGSVIEQKAISDYIQVPESD